MRVTAISVTPFDDALSAWYDESGDANGLQ